MPRVVLTEFRSRLGVEKQHSAVAQPPREQHSVARDGHRTSRCSWRRERSVPREATVRVDIECVQPLVAPSDVQPIAMAGHGTDAGPRGKFAHGRFRRPIGHVPRHPVPVRKEVEPCLAARRRHEAAERADPHREPEFASTIGKNLVDPVVAPHEGPRAVRREATSPDVLRIRWNLRARQHAGDEIHDLNVVAVTACDPAPPVGRERPRQPVPLGSRVVRLHRRVEGRLEHSEDKRRNLPVRNLSRLRDACHRTAEVEFA